jgi:hypothetical protein
MKQSKSSRWFLVYSSWLYTHHYNAELLLVSGKYYILFLLIWRHKSDKNMKFLYSEATIIVINKLHAIRPRKDFTHTHTHTRYCVDVNQTYNIASFATLLLPSCIHSPGLRCSCYNVTRFYCNLEACNLVTAAIFHKATKITLYCGPTTAFEGFKAAVH